MIEDEDAVARVETWMNMHPGRHFTVAFDGGQYRVELRTGNVNTSITTATYYGHGRTRGEALMNALREAPYEEPSVAPSDGPREGA